MDFNKYKNIEEYFPFGDSRGEKYREEANRIDKLFYDDCAAFLGYSNNLKRSLLESKGYERGHSGGYEEIFNCLIDLYELIL